MVRDQLRSLDPEIPAHEPRTIEVPIGGVTTRLDASTPAAKQVAFDRLHDWLRALPGEHDRGHAEDAVDRVQQNREQAEEGDERDLLPVADRVQEVIGDVDTVQRRSDVFVLGRVRRADSAGHGPVQVRGGQRRVGEGAGHHEDEST